MFTVKKLWPLSTIALRMVVLPMLSITYQHNGLRALYLFWAVDKLGNLDELVTLVLSCMRHCGRLWVRCLVFHSLWPVCRHMTYEMSVNELCSGCVLLEVTYERKVIQVVR